MVDNDFFSRYNDELKSKTAGIPGFVMNKPLCSNTLAGKIGLELEIEAKSPSPNEGHLDGVTGSLTGAKWNVIRDGSLRGDYSREYIVTVPILPEEVEPMLNGLFETFASMKTEIQNSNRCSTHVHLNMGGKKINEITAVICLWTVFEDFLIAIQGEERINNHFALAVKDSNSTITAWFDFLKHGSYNFDRNLKYQTLNVLPLFEKGSIENRCGQAANDPQTPATWALFLNALADFACKNYSFLPRLGQDISERGGSTVFEEVCSLDARFKTIYDQVFSLLGSKEAVDKVCLNGFRHCQQLVYGLPWYDWQSLIAKEYVPNPFDSSIKKVKLREGIRNNDAAVPRWLVNNLGNAALAPAPNIDDNAFNEFPRQRFNVGDRVRHLVANIIGTIEEVAQEGTYYRVRFEHMRNTHTVHVDDLRIE